MSSIKKVCDLSILADSDDSIGGLLTPEETTPSILPQDEPNIPTSFLQEELAIDPSGSRRIPASFLPHEETAMDPSGSWDTADFVPELSDSSQGPSRMSTPVRPVQPVQDEDFYNSQCSPAAMRRCHFATLSQADTEQFPTEESFATAMIACFKHCGRELEQWSCCQEPHADGGIHYHFLSKVKGKNCHRYVKILTIPIKWVGDIPFLHILLVRQMFIHKRH